MPINCKNILITGAVLIIMAVPAIDYFNLIPLPVKTRLSNTPLVKWFMPARNSLKKTFNLVHLPYWFKETKLPIYNLSISTSEFKKLGENLPFDAETFSYGTLTEDDKNYVKAIFTSRADNYEEEIKIRYRGLLPNNWDAEKKAFRIKFSKDHLFNGAGAMNLQLPDDRAYFGEILDSYRAKKFGLLTPEFIFVRVYINNRDFGVYLASEPWSKEFLAKNNIYDSDNIFSNNDNIPLNYSLFSENAALDWKSYTKKAGKDLGPFEELNALIALVEKASDEEFEQKIGNLVDLEKFYRWEIVNILANSNHQNDFVNTVLLFRQETGKFEFLPWDVHMFMPETGFYKNTRLFTKRVLSRKKFFDEYNKLLRGYVNDENNLKDDLAYYDNLSKELGFEFYKDQAKIDTDYVFDKKIKQYREWIVGNFEAAKRRAQLDDFPYPPPAAGKNSGLIFEGSFRFFNDIFANIDVFRAQNPQFEKIDERTLILPAGTHIFNKTVIIPKNMNLIIKDGAKLLFAPEVSFISYSPITAVGAIDKPIILAPLYPSEKAWGSFGVVNTGATLNRFRYISVNGGSSDTINGIAFTSQFSLHNAVSEVSDSIFENGRSDDAFHAVLGSVSVRNNIFKNTMSDAIDLDYVTDSKISGNIFYNDNRGKSGVNGDGIDISGVKNTVIEGNKIFNFGDKCVSVGENASVEILNNILSRCNIGIAVKDNSGAAIKNDIIFGNENAGIALYNKKPEFIFGGRAEVSDSIIWGNNKEISKDETSAPVVKNTVVKGGYGEGENISASKPDFKNILPAYMIQFIKHE